MTIKDHAILAILPVSATSTARWHGGRLVHTDIPTRADLEQLLSVRDAACVSIYLPTAPEERGKRDRLEFKNLGAEALEQLTDASIERRSVDDLREVLGDLADDEAFWAR